MADLKIVHWHGKTTVACPEHERQLQGLNRFMGGGLLATEPAPEGSECDNCKNEARK